MVSYGGKSLGTYKTLEECEEVYITKREERIKEVANEYLGIIPQKLYDALMNYKVVIQYPFGKTA